MTLPEDVAQLVQTFASGWQPTPSAHALQQAIRKDRGRISFFDAQAKALCQNCSASVCCARWWQIHEDGSVYLLYHVPSANCKDCRAHCDDEVEEVEVCQTLSRKCTWETLWEKFTGDFIYAFRKEDLRFLRSYVWERLRAYD